MLPAVQKAYDINRWLLPRVARLPKTYKFSLGSRLQDAALDLNLSLVEASYARAKDRPLYRASRLLGKRRLLLRLSRDLGVLSERQLLYISAANDELGQMIGGWLRQYGSQRRD